MTSPSSNVIVVGASWYGAWAHDFYLALKELGVDARIVYTNSLPVGGSGGSASSAILLEKVKAVVRRLGGGVFALLKRLRARLAERQLLREVAASGAPADTLVVFIWTPPSLSVLRKLKKRGVKLALWQGEPAIRDASWSQAFALFDHIFIVDDEWTQYFDDETVRARTALLPLATNPHVHHPVPPDPSLPEKYRADIAFVGLYRPQRAQTLSVLKDLGLKVYGPGWEEGMERFPWLKDRYFGMLSDEEVTKVFNNAKISIGSLGISFESLPTTTQRTFDISCCRKFQLSQYNHLTPRLFGDAVVTFDSPARLFEQASYYLAHKKEREELAQRSYEIALRDHTYVARARELLKACGFSSAITIT